MSNETPLEQANRHVAEGHAEVARLEGQVATETRHDRPTEALRSRLAEIRDWLTLCIERRDRIAGTQLAPS